MAITDPDAVNRKVKPTSDGRSAKMLDMDQLKKRVSGYFHTDPINGQKYFDAQQMAEDFIIMMKLGANPPKEEILRRIGTMHDQYEVKAQKLIIQ